MTLVLLHLLYQAHSATDFCDADPRLLITTMRCNPSTPHLNLFLPQLDKNPYHALHDILWVASHYLSHCVALYRKEGKITMSLTIPTLPTQIDCVFGQDPSPSVSWGSCAAAALAARHKARLRTLSTVSNETKTPSCYTKTVQLGWLHNDHVFAQDGFGNLQPHFRELSFFGRGCIPAAPGQVSSPCDGTQAHGILVPLPERFQSAAFLALRDSITTYLGVATPNLTLTAQRKLNRVRVLVYSRGDTMRRQWANAEQLSKRLTRDSRIVLHFLKKTPHSFRQQAELYSWADVLVAPHGAAMVNTIFMRPGAEVVEVWKYCYEDVSKSRFLPHHWTGWHVHLLGINLQYLQCHDSKKEYRRRNQLGGKDHKIVSESHKVRIEETLKVLDGVFERQLHRLDILRRSKIV